MIVRPKITWLLIGLTVFNSLLITLNTPVANAQSEGISHEISVWNLDGTVTAAMTIDLPNRFANAQGVITTVVTCGGAEVCESSDMTVAGDAQTGVTAEFTIQLSPGDNDLSIRLSGQDRHGTKISYSVDSYLVSVSDPQPINVTYTGHEVGTRWNDGSADLVLWFSITRTDQWPLNVVEADIRCVDDHPCGASRSLPLGWAGGSDDQSVYRASLLVERIANGERRLTASFADASIGWTGPARDQILSNLVATIPVAQNPVVALADYEVLDYNDDLTANASVEFTIQGPTDWPISSIRARLECKGLDSCEAEEVFTPDWIEDSTATEHRWRMTLNGLDTGFARLSATFEVEHDVWFGAPRIAVLNDVVLDLRVQSSFDVRWSMTSADVQGYYMDGSALVDLTLTATQLGTEPSVDGQITAVCYTGSHDGAETCRSIEPAVAVHVGSDGSTVVLSDLRLPQGETSLKVIAGTASGEVVVNVEERIVGMSRTMWECFVDSARFDDLGLGTCSGFESQHVRKWTLETVNLYREGDPSYVEVFDQSLDIFREITGIDYTIVDDVEQAHVEAYVGHQGASRITEVLWDGCDLGFSCAWAYSTSGDQNTPEFGAMSLRRLGDFTPGEGEPMEDGVRFNVVDLMKRVLIPTARDGRPTLPGHFDRTTYIRPHDWLMYQLIYSPDATPGTSFEDLRELIVLDYETLDYEPTLPEPDVVANRLISEYAKAGSISVEMTGMDVRGSVYYPGSTIDVQYADFNWSQSRRAKFSSENWSSIIFGWDEESWSSAGGRWTASESHGGRGRRYRDQIKFDFILADPTRMLRQYTLSADRIEIEQHQDDLLRYTVKHHPESQAWPVPTFEIILDPETYLMKSYTMLWVFGADNTARLPYRVEATVTEYGAEFEIPDEVLDNSTYLANLSE